MPLRWEGLAPPMSQLGPTKAVEGRANLSQVYSHNEETWEATITSCAGRRLD
jgi:hypothetical protein